MPPRRVLLVAPLAPGNLGAFARDALRALGHEVVPWDYRRVAWFGKSGLGPVSGRVARAFQDKLEARVGRRLLAAVQAERPDLVFVVKGELVPYKAIETVTSEWGVRAFVWHPDAPWGPKATDNVWHGARFFDACFAVDSFFEPMYERLGAKRFEMLPFAAAPAVHRPVPMSEDERARWGSDLAYAGNRRPPGSDLHRAFRLALEAGLDLKVWGGTWSPSEFPDVARALTMRRAYGEDLSRVHSASKVVLNVTDDQAMNGVNMRVFEAAAAGACLVTDAQKDLPRYFEAGREVVAFERVEDVPRLVKDLLADPARREALGKAALARALAEHTYEHRMRRVVAVLDAMR